jgi:hypothetical protein
MRGNGHRVDSLCEHDPEMMFSNSQGEKQAVCCILYGLNPYRATEAAHRRRFMQYAIWYSITIEQVTQKVQILHFSLKTQRLPPR